MRSHLRVHLRMCLRTPLLGAALLLLPVGLAAHAQETLPARGSVQIAFSPGDDIGRMVSDALGKARRQVLVQAFSLTHKGMAEALVAAHQRGVDVQVLADRDQTDSIRTSLVRWLAGQGVPVWLDGDHAAAHNKVMVLDAGSAQACVITGSANFTHAAQYRNAENLLMLCDHPALAERYAANWRQHRAHSLRLKP